MERIRYIVAVGKWTDALNEINRQVDTLQKEYVIRLLNVTQEKLGSSVQLVCWYVLVRQRKEPR